MSPSKFFIAIAAFSSVSAFAAPTGTITLSGTIPAATHITVTGKGLYNNLDLSTTAADLGVADVREHNNTRNGYTVTVASANAGQLKTNVAGATGITYTAKYAGTAFTLSATPQTITTAAASTTVVNVVKALAVSYTGVQAENLIAGSYSDTLTFTISAN